MLADGGNALGKEAKNWLKRPVGRQIKVTPGPGLGECILKFLLPEGSCRQTVSRPAGRRGWGIWPSTHFRLCKAAPCARGQGPGHVREVRGTQTRWCRNGGLSKEWPSLRGEEEGVCPGRLKV